MKQYIEKSAVVAEIERRKQKLLDHIICERDKEWAIRTAHQLNRIIWFLDTLEVKEVDLNKEFYSFLNTLIGKDNGHLSEDELFSIAEHFFELGIQKAQKRDEG